MWEGAKVRRRCRQFAFGLVALVAAVYPADWALWRMRGSPVGAVDVFHMTAVPLKGSKEAYYPDGDTLVPCSQSLLPEAGGSACWWLRRHRQVIDRP